MSEKNAESKEKTESIRADACRSFSPAFLNSVTSMSVMQNTGTEKQYIRGRNYGTDCKYSH